MAKLTVLQRTLAKDRETILGLLAITHPHIPRECLVASLEKGDLRSSKGKPMNRNALSHGPSTYTWVEVRGNVYFPDKPNVYIDLLIDNHWSTLSGKIRWEQMEDRIGFRVWIACNDSLYSHEENLRKIQVGDNSRTLSQEQEDKAVAYLVERGYKPASEQEFWTHYWSD